MIIQFFAYFLFKNYYSLEIYKRNFSFDNWFFITDKKNIIYIRLEMIGILK